MYKRSRKIRYAVVGQGYISQIAVLPAFAHARQVAELAALVSDDQDKAMRLARRYRVPDVFGYEDYEECLHSGIDAVYIALPNSMHAEYAIRAARAGVHVLCEKPMAPTALECAAMIDTARESGVKLMIAYRLHFEAATLRAIDLVRSGRIGEPRIFTSTFCITVGDRENIRLSSALGGGTLPDIGIYCINAARSLFGDEPIEVFAAEAQGGDPRFDQVAEGTSCILRFPHERVATFTCSFGTADTSSYQVIGTEGDLVVSPAYEFAAPLVHRLTIDGETKVRTYPRRDQFAPELVHFSECILEDREPGPSGSEGLADVRVIEALQESARVGRPIPLAPFDVPHRPDLSQEIHRPPVAEPRLYHAVPPRGSN